MCAAFEFQGRGFQPGKEVSGAGEQGIVRHVWAGFARAEILEWWQRKGALLLDIPANRFAERSEITGKLVWGNVPQGMVIRGLLDLQTSHPLIKIVTRAATKPECDHFQHPRMPLLERPLFPHLKISLEQEPDLLF
jgi:hypothetical protein